jgi:hypothetical protein
VFIGGIGLYASLKQQQLMGLLLAVPILGVGGLLWFLAERAMFEKAPLGDLAMALFEGLGRGKVDKVRTIATSICLKTERAEANSLPMTFARAIAFDILAETSQDEGSAGEMAKEAVPLFRRTKDMGLNTPMLHFLMATSLRIAKFNEDAIAAYQTYLTMRPDDEGSRKIMTDLLGQTKNN